MGASGGVLTAWKSRLFSGELVFSNQYGISVEITSNISEDCWIITNLYGPCMTEGKRDFTEWLKQIQMPDEIEWLVVGDFNLMRKPEDRNKEGGDTNEMFMFNDAISALGWNEIVLQGRKYTWSNMQPSNLLQKIDWVFSSNAWTLKFPDTTMKGLEMTPSDHCPCLVNIATQIPRPKAFRSENYWLKLPDFSQILAQTWGGPIQQQDIAKTITAKFKNLRKVLKQKQASMSGLKTKIANTKIIIQLLDILEECRDLSLPEWNFRLILRNKLLYLLDLQKIYWKQRANIRWVQLGDATTKFFHAHATIRMRGNMIRQLEKRDGTLAMTHKEKETLLWEEYKERLGTTEYTRFGIEPSAVLERSNELQFLEEPFSVIKIEDIIKALPNDKSPGPDGFSNEFMKAAWAIIKEDMCNLCQSFYNSDICLRSINTSCITLIPKVENARTVNDYRPISLLNSSLKLLTKLLANRLQLVITKLVHRN